MGPWIRVRRRFCRSNQGKVSVFFEFVRILKTGISYKRPPKNSCHRGITSDPIWTAANAENAISVRPNKVTINFLSQVNRILVNFRNYTVVQSGVPSDTQYIECTHVSRFSWLHNSVRDKSRYFIVEISFLTMNQNVQVLCVLFTRTVNQWPLNKSSTQQKFNFRWQTKAIIHLWQFFVITHPWSLISEFQFRLAVKFACKVFGVFRDTVNRMK